VNGALFLKHRAQEHNPSPVPKARMYVVSTEIGDASLFSLTCPSLLFVPEPKTPSAAAMKELWGSSTAEDGLFLEARGITGRYKLNLEALATSLHMAARKARRGDEI